MKNSTIIYIVRHGETFGNAKRLVTGHYNSRLTTKGFEQAKAVAEKLKNVEFSAIFSSDLTRGKQTAKFFLEKHKTKHFVHPLLRERHFGQFEGIKQKTYWKKLGEKYKVAEKIISKEERARFVFHEEVETDISVLNRFKKFISEIKEIYSGKKILIISHGTFIKTLLVHFNFINYNEVTKDLVDNTGYAVIETDGENFEVKETSGIIKIIK